MIDYQKSAEMNGMSVKDLKAWFEKYPFSGKKVWRICDGCGRGKELPKYAYSDLCIKCSHNTKELREIMRTASADRLHTDKTKKKISEALTELEKSDGYKKKIADAWTPKMKSDASIAKMGENNPNFGREFSDGHKKKIADAFTGENHPNFGCKTSNKTKIKISCTQRGISVEDFDGFSRNGGKYCNKFDDECREHNREKYNRKCFLCDKTESENGRRLSVHHEDGNKNQGCDGFDWKLVPLCMSCHRTVHSGRKSTDLWHARIMYLRNNIWE